MAKRSAQGALEYLITYGWAILIIVIIGGALFALGIFNPSTWSSNKRATGFSSVQVSDWKANSTGYTLIAANKFGDTINVSSVIVQLSGVADLCGVTNAAATWNGTVLTSDGSATLPVTNATCLPSPYAAGKTYSATVQIYFTAGSLTHVDTGTLTGKYE